MQKEKKNVIIKAAIKRFSKHGYHKTTLDEIARDLRIGKSSIYHYFSSKEQLFFDTLNYEITNYLSEVKALFEDKEIMVTNKLLTYFALKEDIKDKYFLIYQTIINQLNDVAFDEENINLKYLIDEEVKIVKLLLVDVYNKKMEEIITSLPYFLVYQSWGLLLSSKISSITENLKKEELKNVLLKSVDSLF